MKQAQTHYDKLKVARDAPPEVIRAAYKSLSQKYHPDRNQGNDDAARIMAEINVAYDVLSDPERREFYDMELRQDDLAKEAQSHIGPQSSSIARPAYHEPEQQQQYSHSEDTGGTALSYLLRNRAFYIFVFLCAWMWFGDKSSVFSPRLLPEKTQNTVPVEYVRPLTAPNGQNWPTAAGYIAGYEQTQAEGYSGVIVDNSQNDSDVFVNLVFLKIGQSRNVRHFYIPAFSKFKLEKITSGIYQINYQDLQNGKFSTTKPFILEEKIGSTGVQASNVTIEIYKVTKERKERL